MPFTKPFGTARRRRLEKFSPCGALSIGNLTFLGSFERPVGRGPPGSHPCVYANGISSVCHSQNVSLACWRRSSIGSFVRYLPKGMIKSPCGLRMLMVNAMSSHSTLIIRKGIAWRAIVQIRLPYGKSFIMIARRARRKNWVFYTIHWSQ